MQGVCLGEGLFIPAAAQLGWCGKGLCLGDVHCATTPPATLQPGGKLADGSSHTAASLYGQDREIPLRTPPVSSPAPFSNPGNFGGEKDFFPCLQLSFLLLPTLPAFHSNSCKRISGSESIISLYRCFFNFLPLSEANLFPLKMQCPFPRPQWEFSIP